jgi:Mg2+ and Co2+ transporter CorA
MTPQELIDMTDTKEKQEHILISYIRQYANERYEQGWDAVIEAWSDGDILEYLSDAQCHLPTAIKNIQSWVDLRAEMQDNCQF